MAVTAKQKKNLKKFKKGSKRASAAGKKSKRGISIIGAIRERFENGDVDLKLISKGICFQMAKNPAMARLVMEYVDGKIPDNPQTPEKYIVVSPEIMAMMNKKEAKK